MNLVYVIRNTVNEKKYVGVTTQTLEKRWKQHLREIKENKNNMLICKAIKKHGIDKFYIEKIYDCDSEEQMLFFESFLIAAWKTTKRDNGYNILDASDGIGRYLSKKVHQYNKDGNYITSFNSMTEAAQVVKTDASHISSCIKKRPMYYSAGGFKWAYEKVL